jgi:hypothetical protein
MVLSISTDNVDTITKEGDDVDDFLIATPLTIGKVLISEG